MLSEEPAIQPVPIVMHCEVEPLLTAGTPLVAVGFGREDLLQDNIYGTKHYLQSTLDLDASIAGDINPTDFVGVDSDAALLEGDSGGPLFARLPDGTWRVIAVAVKQPAFYQAVWPHVEWMLEDANVADEQGKLIPCHRPGGEWAPTAACGQFPLSPDVSAGDWTRGPFACNHAVSGFSATCGPPFMPFSSFNIVSPPSDPPMQPEEK